ncbi:MAG: ABC transporter permease subunit [Geodermatophilaceae bacterium]
MSALSDAGLYLNDPLNWTETNGLLDRLVEHITISAVATAAAAAIALPAAIWFGHTGRGGAFTVALSNVSRAVPTLALLTVFAVTPIGFGNRATTIALALFAIPPILTNTYVGFREVDRDIVESAGAMGMSPAQLILRVELPLAVPAIMTGLRTAAVQVVATATLAALVGGGGLGAPIVLGFGQQNDGLVLAAAFLVAVLALLTEAVLVLVARLVTPGPAARRLPRRLRLRTEIV